MTKNPHIEKAIDLCGGQRGLAEKLGWTQSAVSHLLRQRFQITAETARRIEQATDGKVKRRHLRPDLFGPL